MNQITVCLVGFPFKGLTAEDVISKINDQASTQFSLVADPDNPVNKNAIKLVYGNEDIGFISNKHLESAKLWLDKNINISLESKFDRSIYVELSERQ